jgi:hypothetical protein
MASDPEYLRSAREYNEMAAKNEEIGEPVICSKCNMTFPSDSEFIQHYDEGHEPESNIQ